MVSEDHLAAEEVRFESLHVGEIAFGRLAVVVHVVDADGRFGKRGQVVGLDVGLLVGSTHVRNNN